MALTIDELCSVLHYAYLREAREHKVEVQPENSVAWSELPEANRNAMRGAMRVLGDIIRKDEREDYRKQISECLDDLRRNTPQS